MAPILEKVHNESGKSVHVDIGSKSFDIDNGASQQINIPLTTDEYTKIFNIGHEDDLGYLLKYDVPNIKINDALGKKNGVDDSSVQLDSSKTFCLNILKDEINIICNGKSLGIYQPEGTVFYAAVAAYHMTQGGVIVKGGYTGEEDATEAPDA